MKYTDSAGGLDTARKILKVNHAGEIGAINIYKAQIFVSKLLRRNYVPLLEQFMRDEERHRDIFWKEIRRRNGVRCKSYWLCGIGGYLMGFVSALLGKSAIMACTLAVESVVVEHLKNQMMYLESRADVEARDAVGSILEDEEHHRNTGLKQGGQGLLYAPFRFVIRLFTEAVIRFGMR